MVFLFGACAIGATASDLPEQRREAAASPNMRIHVIRLRPGADLLKSLSGYASRNHIRAAVVLTTVGSLQETRLRLADRPNVSAFGGKAEIVSLVGTLDAESAHLHLSVSDGRGKTTGGHLVEGCLVYTTAEIAIGELPAMRFSREMDTASGYPELKVDLVR